ncbi:MAG: ribosome assembly factor SBDS [Candidatus Aenigmarchaeota archaeon]|nr:ribosome assembly factor SBDS [Candidatus Aenigmarchaeota archaeon]
MVSVEDAVVCRLKTQGMEFEILVDPDKALEFKKGKSYDLSEILAVPEVYRDVRKALRASEEELKRAFGTSDVWKIAERIIREGSLQLTTEQRRRFIEEKKKEIVNLIARRAVDPRTNLPHPPQRILNAIEQSGVNIDPFQDAELQLERVVKSIKPLIPIKFQKVTIEVKVPVEYTSQAYGIIKSLNVVSQDWGSDGSLKAVIEIPAGIQDEVFAKLAKATKGNFETKVLKREDM